MIQCTPSVSDPALTPKSDPVTLGVKTSKKLNKIVMQMIEIVTPPPDGRVPEGRRGGPGQSSVIILGYIII